jgi:Flp pilus assembly protein TadG
MKHLTRKASKGVGIVATIGVMIVGLMVSSVAVDVSYMLAEHAHLQNAADAAALAAAQEFTHSSSNSASGVRTDARAQASALASAHSSDSNAIAIDTATDVTFGYIDPANPTYNSNTFTTPSNDDNYSFTGGYNAVRVRVRRTTDSPAGGLPALMANLFGINMLNVEADSVAMIDNNVGQISSGLRPFYVCGAQYEAALATGDLEGQTIRIYGDHHSINGQTINECPDNPSGNWGFADLRDGNPGAPGNSTISRWVQDGFGSADGEDPVVIGQNYSTQPGNAISSNGVKTGLQQLKNSGTIITLPLINYEGGGSASNGKGKGKGKGKGNNSNGSGSNVSVPVEGFAAFVITDYKTNGSASSRYIEGYFTRGVCNATTCTGSGNGSGQGGGLFRLKLVS